jgi:hypothetical protein
LLCTSYIKIGFTIGQSLHSPAADICVNSLPATIALHEQCKRKLFSLFEVDELVAIAFLVHIFIYGQMSKMSAKVNILLLSPIINCIIAMPFSYSKRKKKSERISTYTLTHSFVCIILWCNHIVLYIRKHVCTLLFFVFNILFDCRCRNTFISSIWQAKSIIILEDFFSSISL